MSTNKKCVVKQCPGNGKTYCFPPSAKAAWMENLNLSFIQTRTKVCEMHFRPECFLNGRLRRGSMPTENLGYKPPNLPIFSNWQIVRKTHESRANVNITNDDLHAIGLKYRLPVPLDDHNGPNGIGNREQGTIEQHIGDKLDGPSHSEKSPLSSNEDMRFQPSMQIDDELDGPSHSAMGLLSFNDAGSIVTPIGKNHIGDKLDGPSHSDKCPLSANEDMRFQPSMQIDDDLDGPSHEMGLLSFNDAGNIESHNDLNVRLCSPLLPMEIKNGQKNKIKNIRKSTNKILLQKVKSLRAKMYSVKLENSSLKKKIRNLEIQISKISLDQEKENDEIQEFNYNEILNNSHSKTFIKMISRPQSEPLSVDEQMLATNIFMTSPRSYRNLRNNLGFNLPCESTIKNWLPLKDFDAGFEGAHIQHLKNAVAKMEPFQRNCILNFDEMPIQPSITYIPSSDRAIGYVDLGDGLSDKDRYSSPATGMLAFMVRGINSDWEYILGVVFVNHNIVSRNYADIVQRAVKACQNLGLTVKVLISDQSRINMSTFDILHIREFFRNDLEYVCDYVHLFKSIRNNLISRDFEIDGNVVSWSVIEKLFQDDSIRTVRLAPKLTAKHIYPELFDKMDTKLAVQVFSHTVSQAILSSQSFFPDVQIAVSTADFLGKMNELFDLLHKKSLTAENNSSEKLQEFSEYLKRIKMLQVIESRSESKASCILELSKTCSSINKICTKLIKNNNGNGKHIFLSIFNQDSLEHFFQFIKSKIGTSTSPTVTELRFALKNMWSMTIVIQNTVGNANCIPDFDYCLDWSVVPKKYSPKEEAKSLFAIIKNESIKLDESADPFNGCLIDPPQNYCEAMSSEPNIEDLPLYMATRYMLATFVFKLFPDENCLKCVKHNSNELNDKSEELIKNKICSNLKNPSNAIFAVSVLHIQIFMAEFQAWPNQPFVLNVILKKCVEETNMKYPYWFAVSDPCALHRRSILVRLIKALLHWHCKWLHEKFTSERSQILKINQELRNRNKKCSCKEITDYYSVLECHEEL